MCSAWVLHPPPAFVGKSESSPGDGFRSATSDVATQTSVIQQAPGRRLGAARLVGGASFVNSAAERAAAAATCGSLPPGALCHTGRAGAARGGRGAADTRHALLCCVVRREPCGCEISQA